MKTKLLLAIAVTAAVITGGLQKVNAQWLLGGNNLTKDTALGTKNSHPVKIITNNVERIRIDVNGRIGIGTTSPSGNLDIEGVDPVFKMNFTSIVTKNSGKDLYIRAYESPKGLLPGNLILQDGHFINGMPFFAGKVGIGTDSPLQKLHVVGASIIATNTIINPSTTPNAVVAGAIHDGSGWSVTSGIGGKASIGQAWGIGSIGSNLYFGFSDGSNDNSMQTGIQIAGNRNVLLVPGNSGHVGIGTNSPQQRLSIDSGMNVDQANHNNGTLAPGITFGSNSGEGIASKRTSGGNQYGLDFYIGFTSRMSITNAGKVGIGTTTPQAKLEVKGDALVNGITVGLGGGGLLSNTTVGNGALHSNISGGYNTAIGYDALYSNNTSSAKNTAVGYQALQNNTSGSDNTATGIGALQNGNGSANTAFGAFALTSSSGSSNTAVGYGALEQIGSGQSNTALGTNAGQYAKTNNYCTYVGNDAGNREFLTGGIYCTAVGDNTKADFDNSMALGAFAIAPASNQIVVGNNGINTIGGEVDWSTYSDARIKDKIQENVPGLKFIDELRPVTFYYNLEKENKLLGIIDTTEWTDKRKIEKIQFTGFLAQEVEAAVKKIKYNFSGIHSPENDHDMYNLRYGTFVVPLVKAVQELSSQNDSLKQSNQALNNKVNALSDKINQIENAMSQCCSGFSSNMQSTVNSGARSKTINGARLDQNIPNPFNNTSSVGYYIPSGFHNAQLIITNVSGKTLKTYSITQSGLGKQIIGGNELTSGVYQYSLIVDGKLIETKKMALVK